MREIKFREAIYKDDFVKFHYWGYSDGLSGLPFDSGWGEGVRAIEQYTGLKDKDGNEIYEGDLIGENKRLVVFTCGQFAVDCRTYKISLHNFMSNDPNRIVAGNVHENKE